MEIARIILLKDTVRRICPRPNFPKAWLKSHEISEQHRIQVLCLRMLQERYREGCSDGNETVAPVGHVHEIAQIDRKQLDWPPITSWWGLRGAVWGASSHCSTAMRK
jgi:hypothetical protein